MAAATLCAGQGHQDMPLGLQFIGLRNEDLRALAVTQWAEAILNR